MESGKWKDAEMKVDVNMMIPPTEGTEVSIIG